MTVSVTSDASSAFTLPSGLRVLLIPTATTDVVYAGIAIATGTRHELESESGMAHLVEHMTFKGTATRTARQITGRIESVGGELNAYTAKEETIYYAAFHRQHLHRAIPLLMDMAFGSTYPQAELEHEREVVIDEIESYNDSPADLIYDDFEALLFPNQPLGRNILGNADRLRQYHSSDLQAFASRRYTTERALLFVRGNITKEQIMREVHHFSPIVKGGEPSPSTAEKGSFAHMPSHLSPQDKQDGEQILVSKNTHQAHVMLGSTAYAITDSRLPGLALLMNLLGGPAMNARLCQSLREKAGLVYTVEAGTTAYTDTGLWSIYFGCDHEDVQRCLRLVHRELRRLTQAPLSPRALAAAQRQLCGQLAIGAENTENHTLATAKLFLHTNHVRTLSEQCSVIWQLTPETLHQIAMETLQPQRITTLIYQ